MSDKRVMYRYSLAFKQKVICEIESGKFTVEQARRFYDIGGKSTIEKWLRKLGGRNQSPKGVRIQMPAERDRDRVEVLKQEKQELEHALAQTQLRLLVAESLLESVEEHYHIDVKKTFGPKVRRKRLPKSRRKS